MRRLLRHARAALVGAALVGWGAAGFAQELKLPPLEGPSEESAPFTIPMPAGQPAEPKKPAADPVVMPEKPGGEPAAPAAEPAKPAELPAVGTSEPTPAITPAASVGVGNPAAVVESLFGPSSAEAATQTPGNPTARQEPAVSIEWIGPATAKVGVPADYTVAVRNVCNIAVQKVILQVRVPQGVTVASTEPKAEAVDNVLMWEVGTLMPKQEKHLRMGLVSPSKGDMSCQAWVTFTGSSVMKLQVREPKLLLKTVSNEKALVGDPASFTLTVSNPGDHPAERVKLTADLSEGLEHARGKQVIFDLGNLAPGETRSVQVICITKAGGQQTCEVLAEADGLKANDSASVEVIMPQIDLEVVGPKLRYLDRKALYSFKVTNPGDAPASNVTITETVPAGFKFVSADGGGRHDFAARTVQWYVGEMAPGQSKEVKVELLAINPGEHVHKVQARASRGLQVDQELITRVEGLSAIMSEVIDIEDPIEVGADTGYEIRVTNTGSKTETDVKLTCTIPPEMKFKAAQAPVRYQQVGNQVIFEPLPKLAPRADAIYRIVVTATEKGDARFETSLTSTNLVEPVLKQESTRIYAD